MGNLVKDFGKARKDFIILIDSFPNEKREFILFDKWSLKNIIAHLSGWAKYQTKTLKILEKRGKQEIPKGMKTSINEDFVSQREKWSWEKVYQEFLDLTGELIKKYENLPKEVWPDRIYNGGRVTAKDFIKIEIKHYSKTHGPQIKKVLRKLV